MNETCEIISKGQDFYGKTIATYDVWHVLNDKWGTVPFFPSKIFVKCFPWKLRGFFGQYKNWSRCKREICCFVYSSQFLDPYSMGPLFFQGDVLNTHLTAQIVSRLLTISELPGIFPLDVHMFIFFTAIPSLDICPIFHTVGRHDSIPGLLLVSTSHLSCPGFVSRWVSIIHSQN